MAILNSYVELPEMWNGGSGAGEFFMFDDFRIFVSKMLSHVVPQE